MTSLHRRFFTRRVAAAFALAALTAAMLATATSVWAQTAPPPPTETVEAEPIRCWWRLSSGAVRTGETFSLVLTCAVLENEQVQIVPDESHLGTAVVSLAPFDIAGGEHPADLHTANRRFFQYDYTLRMINPDFIGKDVPIPDLSLHFRVNSKMSGNAALQGRDFVYQLPPLTIKILGMVPGDAADIRDSSNQGFGAIESLRFRASMLRIVAVTLLTIGGLVALISLARLLRRTTRKGAKEAHVISDRSVLGAVGRELSAVQHDAEQGWNQALAARALAPARIAAAYAIGRHAVQQLVSSDVAAGEGRLTVPARRGKATAIWSTVTADDLTKKPAGRSADMGTIEGLRSALSTFTVAGFSRGTAVDRSALDAALTRVADAASSLKQEYSWPRSLLRRWFNKGEGGDRLL